MTPEEAIRLLVNGATGHRPTEDIERAADTLRARVASLEAALREIRDTTAAECLDPTGRCATGDSPDRGSWCSWCVADAALSGAAQPRGES
jgi:hypothetical protein